jgi:hypothetical protein
MAGATAVLAGAGDALAAAAGWLVTPAWAVLGVLGVAA